MLHLAKTKAKLLGVIDPYEFYRKYFPKWDGQSNVSCLFHRDKQPSFNINRKTGAAFCHSAGCPEKRFASVVHFYERYHHTTEEEAVERLCKTYKVEMEGEARISLTPKHILFWNSKLTINARVLQVLQDIRGITKETVDEYLLGFDPTNNRITIPCFNFNNKLVNVRRYELTRESNTARRPKMLSLPNVMGGDSKALYPEWKLKDCKDDTIILFGGEMDCLLARQAGFNGVTSLAGEDVFEEKWLKHFKDRKVFICLDQDDAGKKAGTKIKEYLKTKGIAAHRVILPFRRPNIHKDFTDWVVKEGNEVEELKRFLRQKEVAPTEDTTPAIPASLSEALNPDNMGKRYALQGIIAAKTDNPYLAPKGIKAACSGTNPNCPVCMADNSEIEFVIASHDPRLLNFIEVTDHTQKAFLRTLLGIPKSCHPNITVIDRQRCHIIYIINDTNYTDSSYLMQKCFYTGPDLEANRAYKLTGRLVAEPRNQKSALLLSDAEPANSSVENFKLTPQVRKILEQFHSKDETGEGVFNKVMDIAEDHSVMRTHIIDRLDLHVTIMLAYCSPLHFYFDKGHLERGWLNVLVLGDTASGKSKVVEKLSECFQAGEYVSAENCSYMGLIGGIMPMADRTPIIRWGKLPLNDRKLLIVEELSGLATEDIGRMTDVRSSGIAKIDKAGLSGKVHARTRLIILSNTRHGKNLHDYPSGAMAVAELVGNMEDIRRFDAILTTRNAEVNVGKINQTREQRKEGKYSAEAHRLLVAWIWSLKPEQTKWTKEAKMYALEKAQSMGKEYHSFIPIFKGEDGRYKIARIANSYAGQCFSCDAEGNLIVKSCHVKAAVKYLNMLYMKPSMNYLVHSQLKHAQDKLGNEQVIAGVLSVVPPDRYKKLVGHMLSAHFITEEEFAAQAMVEDYEAKKILKKLAGERCLTKNVKTMGWSVTPQMREWLQKNQKQKGITDE